MTKQIRRALCLILTPLLLGTAGCAHHGEPDDEHVGLQTERWLELQREGTAAGPLRGMPVDAARRAQDRYLESFERPIPDHFEPERP